MNDVFKTKVEKGNHKTIVIDFLWKSDCAGKNLSQTTMRQKTWTYGRLQEL